MLFSFKGIDRLVLLDALCLAAPVGMFYDSIGRILIWSLFIVSMASLRQQRIDYRLFCNSACYLVSLALISLFSLSPILSLRAVFRILLGFLIFIPGVYVGIRWRGIPPRAISFIPVLILAISHLASPQLFGEHLFFGFDENPNIAGRGLTVAILGLFIAGCSLINAQEAGQKLSVRRSTWALYALCVLTFFVLLVVSNFRSGWLGLCAAALYFLFTSRSLSVMKKFLVSLTLTSWLLLLISFKDYKGFGYGSLGERLDLWSRSLSAWHEGFFLFGSGFSSFFKMSHIYFYGDVSRAFKYPHNIVVEILFSVGILGLVATLIFLAFQLRIFLTSNLDFRSLLARSALASVLAMATIGQFDMEFATFDYIGSISFFCGVLYAQRADGFGLLVPSSRGSD